MNEPTFAELAELLEGLGFRRRDVPNVRVVFTVPDREDMFVLRLHRDEEPVDAAGLAAIRFQLDAWGYLDRDRFDAWIRERSLAG